MTWRRLAPCALLTLGLLAVPPTSPAQAATGPGPVQAPTTGQVTADALPTVQHNGVAWTQVLVGNTVYVGGEFTAARPAGAAPGTHLISRANVLAYDLTTGRLISGFAPGTNGAVYAMAVSPDHTRLYLGGNFTRVGTNTHTYLAAINLSTGAVDDTFNPVLNAPVHAITATNGPVYVGGLFTTANGQARTRLAAFARAGGLIATWAPSADNIVRSMLVTPNGTTVVIGGSFLNLNGTAVKGIGAVNAYTGASVAWRTNQTVYDYGSAGIYSLSTDGTKIYGTGFNTDGAPGNLEGMFAASATDGTVAFLEDCHGDTYGSLAVNGAIYTVGHAHNCYTDGGWANPPLVFRRAMAFTNQATGTLLADPSTTHGSHEGEPAPSIINWFPDLAIGSYTRQNQAAWSIVGNSQYIALGGEFPTVNGTGQQGLVRFAVRPIAPAKVPPHIPAVSATPTVSQTSSGVQVTLPGYWDADGVSITYQLIRDGNLTKPAATTTASGTFWRLPGVTMVDTTATPGSHTYRVRGVDSDGNVATGKPVTITVS